METDYGRLLKRKKAIMEDKRQIIDAQIQLLSKKIKEKFNPHKIILFGSYAYGKPEKGDIR